MKCIETTVNNTTEYYIKEGTAYIGFIVMGGSGFRVDKVKEGETWVEGMGEEFCVVAASEEEAWAYINRTYFKSKL